MEQTSTLTNNDIANTISRIISNELTKLEPTFKAEIGLQYDEPKGLNIIQQVQILKFIETTGCLTRTFVESVMQCSKCSSPHMYLRLSCNLCKSSNILRGRVIEHLRCGYISFDSKFLLSTGILVCPKCNKRLNAIGIDYSKPALYYQCLDCKAMLPETDETYHCVDCGNNSSYEELGILQIPHYIVNKDKMVREFGRREYLNSISSRLSLDRIRNAMPGHTIGKSGIQHSFSLVVFNDKDGVVPVAGADSIVDGQPQEMLIMSLFAKCMDTGISHRLIFSEKSVDEKARSLAEAYGIHIIENISNSESLEKVVKMIKEIVIRN